MPGRLTIFRLSILFSFLFTLHVSGQKETFDIVSFLVPPGWNKSIQNETTVITSPGNNQGTFCLVTVYKSINSTGEVTADFSSAWKELAVNRLNISVEPKMENPESEDGWSNISGSASFVTDGANAIALLTVISNKSRTLRIMVVTNNQSYLKDLEAFYNSISLNNQVQTEKVKKQVQETLLSGTLNDYVFTVPPGWKKEENTGEIVLRGPDNASVISILPPIQSSGDLENDMKTVFWQIFTGWEPDKWNPDEHISTKGVSSDGWSYFKDELAISKSEGEKKSQTYAFVFLTQLNGKIGVIAGSYPSKSNLLNESNHVDWQLFFHSLHFKDYKPLADSPVVNDILGSWITGGYSGIVTYTFAANGHFSSGAAYSTSHQVSDYSVLEKTTSFTGDGTYTLKGNELTRNYDKTKKSDTEKVRVFYQKQYGDWQKRLGLLNRSVVDSTLYEVTLAFEQK